MNVLFLCSRNRWRSLTAEKIFQDRVGYSVRSAGTENNARIKVTSGDIGWADIIFVMEKKHLSRIKEKYRDLAEDKQIVVLHIADEYGYMDEDLIELLESSVSEHLDI